MYHRNVTITTTPSVWLQKNSIIILAAADPLVPSDRIANHKVELSAAKSDGVVVIAKFSRYLSGYARHSTSMYSERL